MSLREAIRAATVGAAKNFKTDTFTIDGQTIEIRQLSVRERTRLNRESEKAGENSERTFGVLAVISMCYIPGTDERCFEDADIESFFGQPCGSWFDQLTQKCMDMILGAQDAEKNSAATPTAS